MTVTHSLHDRIAAVEVRYLKLGRGGAGAADCIHKGELGLSFREVPNELCERRSWEQVSAFLVSSGKTKNVASNQTREIRDFYELGADTLWITFHGGSLWWAFAEPEVRHEPHQEHLQRRRRTLGPWRSTDIVGEPLLIRDLSTKLTKVSRYQGTLCAVREEAAYLLRRINAEEEPIVAEALETRRRAATLAERLVGTLHWRDFEILVDLIFAASGWRRIGVLGETQTDLDLMVEQIATGERAFVQVKSRATAKTLDDYVERFRTYGGCTRMFFVCHSPSPSLLAAPKCSDIDLWFSSEVAERALRAGLLDWLIARFR